MLAGPGDSSRSPTTSNTQTADPRSKQSAAMARQISAKNMKATSDTDLCAPSKADKVSHQLQYLSVMFIAYLLWKGQISPNNAGCFGL